MNFDFRLHRSQFSAVLYKGVRIFNIEYSTRTETGGRRSRTELVTAPLHGGHRSHHCIRVTALTLSGVFFRLVNEKHKERVVMFCPSSYVVVLDSEPPTFTEEDIALISSSYQELR